MRTEKDMMELLQEKISWNPVAQVEKWSPDQYQWAVAKSGVRDLQGWQLRQILGTGAEEITTASGNLLTYSGLAYILSAFTSLTTTVAARQFANGYCAAGVGDGSGSVPTAAVTDTDLTGVSNIYYMPVDAGYPAVGSSGSTSGVMTVQSTFTTAVANFAWNEWGLYGCPVSFTQGQNTKPSSSSMINHRGVSLGTKTSSAPWTLSVTVTLS